MKTLYLLLADLVVLTHFAFVLFVVAGGLIVIRRKRWAWVHAPVVLWGAVIEFTGWNCPLTPLENWFLYKAGATGYGTSFIEHYVLPILYPSLLTRELQIVLGLVVVVINVAIYGWIFYRRKI